MKLTRISEEEIKAKATYLTYMFIDLGSVVVQVEIENLLQAQLEACEKEAQEKVREIFEEIEHKYGYRIGRVVGISQSGWQSLKQKHLNGEVKK